MKQKFEKLEKWGDDGDCVEFRGGVHMMLKASAVLSPEVTADLNAYHVECRLLDILRNAGYVAKYDLGEDKKPVSLQITIPAGKDKGGYPEKDEYLEIAPKGNDPYPHILTVSQKLTEPSARSDEIILFPKRDFKIGFLNWLAERYQVWKYRRTVRYLNSILPNIYKHLPQR